MEDFVTHRELDQRFQGSDNLWSKLREADREAIDKALQAAEKAVDKANEANEKRLDGLNELKGMAADQASHFARKDVVDARIETLGERISAIEGRLLAIATIGTIFGIGGVVFALLK